MDEMQVYISNLGKYNEGELVGAWFTPPLDYDDVAETIGLNDSYEEYAIHDYELPFVIDEYEDLEEINRLCAMVMELPESLQDELKALLSYFGDIEELYDNQDSIIYYSGCDNMTDFAYEYIAESGMLGEILSSLQNYIDYEALGNDMYSEGNFVETSNGLYQIID